MPEQVAYQFVNFLFDGKMVSSKNAFALGSNEYQMVKNMRYVEDGVVTRRGCSIHNSTDVNDGSTEIRSITQMVVDRYSMTRTIIQADDLKYYFDDDLPIAGAFAELPMYPTTEHASALKAISAGVGEAEIYCNGEENWVYHGTQPRPTAIFHYDDSASSYISWLDEIYTLKTDDVMVITGLTSSDYIYLGFWVPFTGAYFNLTEFNVNAAVLSGEYFNGGWATFAAWSGEHSTGADLEDDCSAFGSWVDGDAVNGVSTLATFQGRSVFSMASHVAAGSNNAQRNQDIGTYATGATFSIRCWHDQIGTLANGDQFQVWLRDGTNRCNIIMASDGLFVYNGAAWNEVGTNIVVQGQWIEYTFDVADDFNTVDVYVNGILIEAGVDCSYASAGTDGSTVFSQVGTTTDNNLTYVDAISISEGTGTLQTGGAFNDGTLSAGATFAQAGLVSWDMPTDWVPTMVEGGLWYFVRFQPDATLGGQLPPSNTTHLNSTFDDLTGWIDDDGGGAETTQATWQSEETLKLDSGASTGGGAVAQRKRDMGSFGARVTCTMRVWHDALGTEADGDIFQWRMDGPSSKTLRVRFASDGLRVYDGVSWNEVGTDIVDVGEWTVWTFDLDWSGAGVVDVWKEGVLIEADVDCSYSTSVTDGECFPSQFGDTTAFRITYIDYILIGDDLTGEAVVKINNIYMEAPMQLLPNLWDQNWQPVSGAYMFDDSVDEYRDYLPKVIDGITATYMFLEDFEGGADKDGIYIGTPFKPLAFRIKIDPEFTQAGNAEFNVIEGWDGSAWDAGTGLSDTTKGGAADIASLSQNGIISFNNGSIAYRRGMLEGEEFPMYWTRLEMDADAVTADVRIWDIAYVPDIDDPSGAQACMEFKDRLMLVGPKDYPNEVWISAPFNPQGFNGNEFTKLTFGDGRTMTDGVSFFNEAVVFKQDSTWLIQGFRRVGAGAFGRLRLDSRVGAFRKTAQLGRIWITEPGAAADDYRNVIFFQHRTGVYFSDGNKPVYISDDISSYFDENHADYVGAANIAGIDSWFDYSKDEYHLLFSTGLELIYNAWFKKWSVFQREVDLKSGGPVVGASGEPLTYGGTAIGKVLRLEDDTSDKDSSDADAAIDAHVITKAHWPGEMEHEINFRRLMLVAEGNLTNGGVITINGAQDGGDITDNTDPQYFTLDDSLDTADTYDHKGYVKDMFPFSIGDDDIEETLHTLQLKFGCDTLDLSIKLVGYGLGVAIQRMHFDG